MRELGHRRVQIRTMLEHAGFQSALRGVADLTDCCVTRGLVERFQEPVDTFHFLFGNITISCFNFAMLMVLGFTGEPLVYQEDVYTCHDQHFHHFDLVMEFIPQEIISPIASSLI